MTQRTEAATNLERPGRIFLTAVIAVGLVVIATSVFRLYEHPVGYQWYMLAALTLISESATVKLPSVPASISISETFVFASVLLFGSSAGTVTVALDGLVISFWMAKRRPEWYRALFNMAAPAISIWFASQLLFAVAHVQPLSQQPASVDALLLPLLTFAIVYFGLNSWLIAFVVAFETGISPYRIWRENFLWLSLNYFSGASVALLLVVYTRDVDLKFIGVIVPLLLVLYVTFKTSLGRVEDANGHLTQLNRLYLSTVETLAMAIDAKDQITHGHIRRVQTLAVGLARKAGVTDPSLISAIEAAALLHDTGKLAVPEYILNKPGRLSAAEFEKMKLHVTVGADILSAVDFPYPVVPIVRSHHENWNGSGYPAGLKGTEIPIGARILAVVDCFDALTSDRPYRPRLEDQAAIQILLERRGSMYDPLIVDTFIRVRDEIAPGPMPPSLQREALNEIATSSRDVPNGIGSAPLGDVAASADEILTLYELARALAGQANIADTGDVIAKHLLRLIPSALCVFYSYDATKDELQAKHALGDAALVVKGLRIGLGQRLSGWVAANRQTIINSDPVLDLGEAGLSLVPRLRNCLSTPLLLDNELVGVLTLYSSATEGFNEDHRRIIEMVASQIAQTFKRASDFDSSGRRDGVTGLPSFEQLEHFVDSIATSTVAATSKFSLLFIDVVGLEEINARHGRSVRDNVLRHVVHHARSSLRVADILFRCENDELVAFLGDADVDTVENVARRIHKSLQEHPLAVAFNRNIPVDVKTTSVCLPQEGKSLQQLITTTRARITSTGTLSH